MKTLLERYIEAGGQKEIIRDGYRGHIVDVQIMTDGYVCGIYRLCSGDTIGGNDIKLL